MRKKWLEIIINLLFWTATAWLFISTFAIQTKNVVIINGKETVSLLYNRQLSLQIIACILLSALMFYINLWLFLKFQYRNKSKLALKTAGLLLACILMYYTLPMLKVIMPVPALMPGVIVGIFIFYYTISLTYGTAKLWLQTVTHNEILMLEKKEAELSLLRSQLHPHFLFNVLNNLLSMIEQPRNQRAVNAIHRLSGLLRYIVYEVNSKKVPIKKEIEFITDYIELHQLKFEMGEIDLDLKIVGAYNDQLCEPGLFIPFVENAFKYGTEPEKKSQILICFDITRADCIQFMIQNPLHEIRKQNAGSGTGITSTLKRLALVFPGRHKYSDEEVDNQFIVRLEIQTNEGNNN